ncbi:putative amine-terminal domain guanylate-binding protein [Paratrimastix pyriformis]|uniref:Amine-terminal domain guanylate-binding protein n=1 Tax=Paratrimastix pyriformis TaxID=342808 RepID=A0ABQ8UDA4_9EUKA|nr:putative amine-terminal domain guanylate-binding protein [Paratrimastix pyriformis]
MGQEKFPIIHSKSHKLRIESSPQFFGGAPPVAVRSPAPFAGCFLDNRPDISCGFRGHDPGHPVPREFLVAATDLPLNVSSDGPFIILQFIDLIGFEPEVLSVHHQATSPERGAGARHLMSSRSPEAPNLSQIWERPLLLLARHDNNYIPNESTLRQIETIRKPIKVVAILGKIRTGKSFLMNQLLGYPGGPNGFALGHTVQTCTKGEGLGDAQELDAGRNHDLMLFTFTVLACSYLIYNFTQVIAEPHIDDLGCVCHLLEKVHSYHADGSDFSQFAPSLLFLCRDCQFVLPEGQTLSSYLEQILRPKGTNSTRNETRRMINKIFPHRSLMELPRPVFDERQFTELDRGGLAGRRVLRPEFTGQLQALLETVLRDAPLFGIRGNNTTGVGYAEWIRLCVSSLNSASGQLHIPEMCEAVKDHALMKGIEAAFTQFQRDIGKIQLPLDDAGLQKALNKPWNEAQRTIISLIFPDQFSSGMAELQVRCQEAFDLLGEKNARRFDRFSDQTWEHATAQIRDKVQKKASYRIITALTLCLCVGKLYTSMNQFNEDRNAAQRAYLAATEGRGPGQEHLATLVPQLDALGQRVGALLESAENRHRLEQLNRQLQEQVAKTAEMKHKLAEQKDVMQRYQARLTNLQKDRAEDEARFAREKREFDQRLEQAARRQDERLQEANREAEARYQRQRAEHQEELRREREAWREQQERRDAEQREREREAERREALQLLRMASISDVRMGGYGGYGGMVVGGYGGMGGAPPQLRSSPSRSPTLTPEWCT